MIADNSICRSTDPDSLELNPLGEVIFSHFPQDTDDEIFIWVRKLQALANRAIMLGDTDVKPIAIDPQFAEWIYKGRGLEDHRLDRLTPEVILREPVLFAVERLDHVNETIVANMFDGHHRYHKAWKLGWTEIPAILLGPDLWKQADVTQIFRDAGMPKRNKDDVVAAFSGIT